LKKDKSAAKTAVCVLLTAAVAAAGLMLPKAAADWEDKKDAGQVTRYSAEQVALTVGPSQLFEHLTLMSQYTYLEPAADRRLTLSSDEALAAAREDMALLCSYLEKCGLYDYGAPSFDRHSEQAYLASSPDGAAAVWVCYLANENGDAFNFSIDDSLGKLLAFSFYTGSSLSGDDSSAEAQPDFDPSAAALAAFCRKCYGCDTSLSAGTDAYSGAGNYTIGMTDGAGNSVSLSLHLSQGLAVFNLPY